MSTPESFQVAGVDGCKAGWFVVIASAANRPADANADCALDLKGCFVAAAFSKVLEETNDCELVCVDIPIGLSDGDKPRECDLAARKVLARPRASSVFPPPVRDALLAEDHETANRINFECSGKRLSWQSFYLLEKIRQVDNVMRPEVQNRIREVQNRIREVHPEISFWALNCERPMGYKKSRLSGRDERIRLLSSIFSDLEWVVARERRPKEVAPDDILDALVAAWTAAQTVTGKAKTLPESPELDGEGLRMEILCPVLI